MLYKKYAKKKEEITQATAKTEEQIRTESIDKQIEDLKKLMSIYDQWGNQTLALFSALSERRIADIDAEIAKVSPEDRAALESIADGLRGAGVQVEVQLGAHLGRRVGIAREGRDGGGVGGCRARIEAIGGGVCRIGESALTGSDRAIGRGLRAIARRIGAYAIGLRIGADRRGVGAIGVGGVAAGCGGHDAIVGFRPGGVGSRADEGLRRGRRADDAKDQRRARQHAGGECARCQHPALWAGRRARRLNVRKCVWPHQWAFIAEL